MQETLSLVSAGSHGQFFIVTIRTSLHIRKQGDVPGPRAPLLDVSLQVDHSLIMSRFWKFAVKSVQLFLQVRRNNILVKVHVAQHFVQKCEILYRL